MSELFCEWWDKCLEDVTEHEQEECEKNGQNCLDCIELTTKRDRERWEEQK